MNPTPNSPDPRLAELQAELEAVTLREAQFRANMVQEFLDRGERNTHLHVLREERAELLKREQESFLDLEEMTRKLEAATEHAAALEAEIAQLRGSISWKLTAPLRALAGKGPRPARVRPAPDGSVEGAVFTYYLHTSPFRIYRDSAFTLRGWAWPQDGRAITGVRVNLSGRIFEGRHGLEEPEVISIYGAQPSNPRPGFEVTFDTPPGRQSLSLEAQVDGDRWLWIMRTTIWCEAKST